AASVRDLASIPTGLVRAAAHDLGNLGRLWALNGARLAATAAGILGATDWTDVDDLGPQVPDDPLLATLHVSMVATWPDLLSARAARYRDRGVGPFAARPAFRWSRQPSGGALVPIQRPDPISFDDLVGYAEQRRVVRRNTEHFLAGLPANNLLLYG